MRVSAQEWCNFITLRRVYLSALLEERCFIIGVSLAHVPEMITEYVERSFLVVILLLGRNLKRYQEVKHRSLRNAHQYMQGARQSIFAVLSLLKLINVLPRLEQMTSLTVYVLHSAVFHSDFALDIRRLYDPMLLFGLELLFLLLRPELFELLNDCFGVASKFYESR